MALDVGRHVFFSQLCFEGVLAAAAAYVSLTADGVKAIPLSLATSIGIWAIQLFVLYPKLNKKGAKLNQSRSSSSRRKWLMRVWLVRSNACARAAIDVSQAPARKDMVHNLYVALEAVKIAGLFYTV